MQIKIKFLRPFSDAVGKNVVAIDFKGTTLEELINILLERYPQLKDEFYTKNGDLADYINIFVNDKPMSAIKGISTELKNGDEILFFIPISGG